MRLTLLLLPGLLACGASSPAPIAPSPVASTAAEPAAEALPDAWPIVLHRRDHVGERYRMTRVATEHRRSVLRVGGHIAREDELRRQVRLEGEVRVVAVNGAGKPTAREITIGEAVLSEGGRTRELLPQGATLRASAGPRGESGPIEWVGGQLSEDDVEALRLVINTAARPVTDDDVFGTDQPQPIGASWPIDAAVAARDLSKIRALTVGPDGVSGSVSLLGVAEERGQRCLEISAELRADGFSLGDLPEGSQIERSSVVATLRGLLPTDPAVRRLRGQQTMRMELVLRMNMDGQEGVMETTNARASESIYYPITAGQSL